MKQRKRSYLWLVVGAVVVLLLAALGLWRFWPRSFAAVTGVEEEDLTQLSAAVVLAGAGADGAPENMTYELQGVARDDDAFSEILAVLQETAYRPSLRNLLPQSSYAESDVVGTAAVLLVWGDTLHETCTCEVTSSNRVIVRPEGGEAYTVYFAADGALFDALTAAIQAHAA